MWGEMASYIKRVALEEVGESKGGNYPSKDTWWWNEEVQKAIRSKKNPIKAF